MVQFVQQDAPIKAKFCMKEPIIGLQLDAIFASIPMKRYSISYSDPAVFANSIKLAFSDSAWETPSTDQDQSLQGRAKDHAS